jgi:hypothetical protein
MQETRTSKQLITYRQANLAAEKFNLDFPIRSPRIPGTNPAESRRPLHFPLSSFEQEKKTKAKPDFATTPRFRIIPNNMKRDVHQTVSKAAVYPANVTASALPVFAVPGSQI